MTAPWQLYDTDGRLIVAALRLADTFLTRLAGLQFRSALPAGHGLLLVPCSAIHTCLMRFPIDVAMLDRQGHVVELHREVAPWRMVRARQTAGATLELPAHSPEIALGQRLRLVPHPDAPLPAPRRSVEFLLS